MVTKVRLTKSQHDTLAWVAYVVNSYSAFEKKDIDRLIRLKLVSFKERPLIEHSFMNPDTGNLVKTLVHDGDLTITREGRKFLRPDSVLAALEELAICNGPLTSSYIKRLRNGAKS